MPLLHVVLLLEISDERVNCGTVETQAQGVLFDASAEWRVIITQPVTYGWAVGELALYSDTQCKSELTKPPETNSRWSSASAITWTPMASGENNAPMALAFDQLTWTSWRSQCYMCEPGQAWIGVRFSEPVKVFCFRLYQWGLRDYKSEEVMLQHWRLDSTITGAGTWVDVLKGGSLAGESWEVIGFTKCAPITSPEYGRVKVTNAGFYPSEAVFTCAGARLRLGSQKLECGEDGAWSGEPPQCVPLIAIIVLVTAIGLLELLAFTIYYLRIVVKKPPPLESKTFIPEDQLGKFTSHAIWGINDEEEEDGSTKNPKKVFRHVVLCPCCRIADTWQSAGFVPYFVGVWIPQLLCPILPCIATYFRFQMHSRFSIKGFSARDFFYWICCIPCVATQEAKYVDHLCDAAEEEAEVMKRAEERKAERDRKHAELKAGEHGAQTKQRGLEDHKHHHHHHKEGQIPSKSLAYGKSVLEMIDSL